MSLPPEEATPDDAAGPDDTGRPGKKSWGTVPSTNRIVIWVIVGGIGLYLVGSGIIGILFP